MERVKFLDGFYKEQKLIQLTLGVPYLDATVIQITLKPVKVFTNSSVIAWILGSFSEIGAILVCFAQPVACAVKYTCPYTTYLLRGVR